MNKKWIMEVDKSGFISWLGCIGGLSHWKEWEVMPTKQGCCEPREIT